MRAMCQLEFSGIVRTRRTYFRHTHLICRQSSSLVSADDVCATECLDRWETSDYSILLCHFLCTKSQADRDDDWKTLWDSCHCQCYCNFEVVDCTFKETTMARIAEIANVDKPDQDTDDRDDLCEHVTEIVDFLL